MLEGWKENSIKYALDKVIDYRGKAPPKSATGVRLITARNVRPGKLDLTHEEFIEAEKYSEWMNRGIPQEGDILFTTEAPLANVCMFPSEGQFAVGQRIVTLRPNLKRADASFLSQYLMSEHGQKRIKIRSTGSTAMGIKSKELLKVLVPLPPLPEQRRIAAILRTWDEAIEKLDTLRVAKAERLYGILQVLLGVDSKKGHNWPVSPLSEVSKRVSRTTDGGDHPVMTISAKSGFLMQSDKFARNMAGRSVERYTMLKQGEFAFNKGNSKTAPYGCIFQLKRKSALIPFVYYCFALDDDLHFPFYEHLFAAGALNHQLSRLINSGVRNDGLFNLYADDFFGCDIPVPPLEKQKKIAAAITALKEEISLIDVEITSLKRQKRGLMQKLLTGEWRVGVDGANTSKIEKEKAHD